MIFAPVPHATEWSLAIHGGAASMTRAALTPDLARAYEAGLADALAAGASILRSGGSALDAVTMSVERLEDAPLFNAGRGSVFTRAGTIELDAAIMDGKTLAAGAVAGLTRTRHPIHLARALMESGEHVMLIGRGAEDFARLHALETVEPAFFATESRWRELETALRAMDLPLPPKPDMPADSGCAAASSQGTVGAVARDQAGHIAAATSTGGVVAKRPGRVGDSGIIGAGTYARDGVGAVSCTGAGEYFIRLVAAYEVCALADYKRLSLSEAVDTVINTRLTGLGGEGGLIAVGADGEIAWGFNTRAMLRACASAGSMPRVEIF